jgi:hypothetical protein
MVLSTPLRSLPQLSDPSSTSDLLERKSSSFLDASDLTFFDRAHSVTQSAYDQPCAPAEGGFDSGFAGLAFQNSTLQNPMAGVHNLNHN